MCACAATALTLASSGGGAGQSVTDVSLLAGSSLNFTDSPFLFSPVVASRIQSTRHVGRLQVGLATEVGIIRVWDSVVCTGFVDCRDQWVGTTHEYVSVVAMLGAGVSDVDVFASLQRTRVGYSPRSLWETGYAISVRLPKVHLLVPRWVEVRRRDDARFSSDFINTEELLVGFTLVRF